MGQDPPCGSPGSRRGGLGPPCVVLPAVIAMLLASTAGAGPLLADPPFIDLPALPSLTLQSRYNHPEIEWRTIRTDHFDIHFYPEEEFTARSLAAIADEVFDAVCDQMDYRLTERIHIVVRDQEEMANGFAFYAGDWMTIWATNLHYRLRGRLDWLPVVLTHEFAHIVSLKLNDPLFDHAFYGSAIALHEDGTNDFSIGAVIPFPGGFAAPTYWVEGGAELWTDQAGHNSWNTSREMLLRASILDDAELSWDQMQTIAGQGGFDRERVYSTGYAFGLYLRDRFGRDIYTELAQVSDQGWRYDWGELLEEATGVPGADLYAQFLASKAAVFEPLAEEIRSRGATGETIVLVPPEKPWAEMSKKERERVGILEQDSIAQYWPRWSPDGRTLAFWRDGGDLVLMPLTDSEIPQLGAPVMDRAVRWQKELEAGSIEDVNDTSFSFSPDGDALVYSARWQDGWFGQPWTPGGGYRNDLYLARLTRDDEGTITDAAVEQLTRDARAIHPAWSPDGRRIAYVHQRDGRHALVWIDPSAPDEVHSLLEPAAGVQIGAPVWSPDGRSIAFTLYQPRQEDLFLLTVDERGEALGGPRPITYDPAEERDPTFSPDGATLYFSSDRSGIFDVHAVDLATDAMTRVTSVVGGAFHPTITPAGHLVFSSFTGHGFKLAALPRERFLGTPVERSPLPGPEAVLPLVDLPHGGPGEDFVDEPYSFWEALQSPWVIPVVAYQDEGVKGGFGVTFKDYLEQHTIHAEGLFGESRDFTVFYYNEQWYPDIYIAYQNIARTFDFGFQTSLNPFRPTDRSNVEVKQRYLIQYYAAGGVYPLSDELVTELDYTHRDIELKAVIHGSGYTTVIRNDFLSSAIRWSDVNRARPPNDIHPRDGREFSVGYTLGLTEIPHADFGEDDGEILDDYTYHRVDASFTEFVPVPFWPLDELDWRPLRWLDERGHGLEISLQGGWIDRNVHYYDELHAGGRIPLLTGGDFSSNVQFSGFEVFSLSGETLLVGSLAYRFPLVGVDGSIDRTWGPFYFDKLYGGIFGTVGNAWSFNGNTDREIPFRDTASNGNEVLVDIGAEVRLGALMFNGFYWRSFARVAYGFQDVFGQPTQDLNRDFIIEDDFPQNDFIDEVEEAGVRFYLGLGTGW